MLSPDVSDRLIVLLAPAGSEGEVERWVRSFAGDQPVAGRGYHVQPRRRRRATPGPGGGEETPGLLQLMRTDVPLTPVPDPRWSVRLLSLTDATTARDVLAEEHLHLVQSRPPNDVRRDDYDRWYAEHMRENLQIGGYTDGWRGWQQVGASEVEPRPVPPHVALYGMDREWDEVAANMARSRERLSAGWPTWFERIEFTPLEAWALT